MNKFAPGSTFRPPRSRRWSTQASAGIGKAGADAAESLATNLDHANSSLEGLSSRVAEQDRASQRMIAEIDRGLALIDERFTELAANGDERANAFPPIADPCPRASSTRSPRRRAPRTMQSDRSPSARRRCARTSSGWPTKSARMSGAAIGEAQGGADRLAEAASAAKPDIGWLRDATVETSEQLARPALKIAQQHERFTALLPSVDDGVEDAQSKLR